MPTIDEIAAGTVPAPAVTIRGRTFTLRLLSDAAASRLVEAGPPRPVRDRQGESDYLRAVSEWNKSAEAAMAAGHLGLTVDGVGYEQAAALPFENFAVWVRAAVQAVRSRLTRQEIVAVCDAAASAVERASGAAAHAAGEGGADAATKSPPP